MLRPNGFPDAITIIRNILQEAAGRPFAIVLAGHNGSGKSTFWTENLSDELQIPLINADRMMLSILPEAGPNGQLRTWARQLRDTNTYWMSVAQQGVKSFVASAMSQKVPFAFETVFSYWQKLADGRHASKIDTIRDLQRSGYFVILIFVGLSSVELSVGRVRTRAHKGGHHVNADKLRARFPRTQQAIHEAMSVADAAVLLDNSGSEDTAYTAVHVRHKRAIDFDIRDRSHANPEIARWLDIVAPRPLPAP